MMNRSCVFAWLAFGGLGWAQQAPAPDVIRTATRVVVLNVVAKDKHGKPPDDLKRDDFVLLDNGQVQRIALFALEEARQASGGPAASTAHLTFTNRPAASAGRVTTLLFDQLNTQLSDQQFAKKEFLRYLKTIPASERVAVFVLGDSLALLHDFSDDTATLIDKVNRRANRAGTEANASAATAPSSNSLTGDQAVTAQRDSFMTASVEPYRNYAETMRATKTAAALETIAAHMDGLAGRKTLIWILGGFPIQLGLHGENSGSQSRASSGASGRPTRQGPPGPGAGRGKRGSGGNTGSSVPAASTSSPVQDVLGTGVSYASDVERAVRALNEADVAVYPVDARGIATPAPFQADRASYGRNNQRPRGGPATDYNYETLETLAEETGGRAFHHINDLSTAMHQAADDARVSHTLAFYPASESLDGAYHRIEVAVERPGVTVRYRPGYVAAREVAVSPSLAEAIANPVALAGIGFMAHLDPVADGYKMSVTIDPRNLTLEAKDGKWTGSLQLLVVGKVEQLTTIPLNLSEAVYRQVEEKGLVLGAHVKALPGTMGFSVGFRDVPSGVVGTLQVILRATGPGVGG